MKKSIMVAFIIFIMLWTEGIKAQEYKIGEDEIGDEESNEKETLFIELNSVLYKMGEYKPITKLFRKKSNTLVIKYLLTFPDSGEKLYFGHFQKNIFSSHPVIIKKILNKWHFKIIHLDRMGWDYLASSKDGKNIIGVIDSQIEGSDWYLRIVHSSDWGNSWQNTKVLKKKSFVGLIKSLELTKEGKGQLVIDDVINGDYEIFWTLYPYLPSSNWTHLDENYYLKLIDVDFEFNDLEHLDKAL